MERRLTHECFAPHIGETYRALPGSTEELGLVLIEANKLPVRGGPRPEGSREPFSLLFRGPREPWLRQGQYPIQHPSLGTPEMFLVPVGPDAEGMRYEAIFN
jgi:hypothetical protein